jgi:hypothetical protein
VIAGGLAEVAYGINVEVMALEAVAEPLTRVDT